MGLAIAIAFTPHSLPVSAQSITGAPDGTGSLIIPHNSPAGSTTYNIQGGSLSSDGANLFHSFQQFGLSSGEIANFLSQPQIQNILGRVVGGNASLIDGLIQVTGSNANLFLMNPAGIVFGPNASLNLPASFTATTANGIGFDGGWFNSTGANNYNVLVGTPNQFAFTTPQPGSLINAGMLSVASGENLTLLGGTVINTGTLSAPAGTLTVAAVPGERIVRISQEGMLLSLEVEPLGDPENQRTIPGSQGIERETLKAIDLPALLTDANRHHATGVSIDASGTLHLTGAGLSLPPAAGTTLVAGTLNTRPHTPHATPHTPAPPTIGGDINILGKTVAVLNANINASGLEGGGTVRIGGDYQGGDNLFAASRTVVSPDTTIKADALRHGDGGRVILWANQVTGFWGEIEARGGSQSGNGGWVEVSGKETLIFRGRVDVGANRGQAGTILLDPQDIIIEAAGSSANDNQLDPDVPFPGDPAGEILFADGGIFTDFTISDTALTALTGDIFLQADRDIIVQPGAMLNFFNQTFGDAIAFEAGNNIDISADIHTNGGSLFFNAGGSIEVGNITTSDSSGGEVSLLAGGSISAGTIDASGFAGDGGAVSLFSGDSINTGNIDTSGDSGGQVSINADGFIDVSIIDASGSFGDGGPVMLESSFSHIFTGDIDAAGDNNGGPVSVTADDFINVGTIDTNGFLGDGGPVMLRSSFSHIFTGDIYTLGDSNGGPVSVTADDFIDVGTIDASGFLGDGGPVTLDSRNRVTAGNINSTGANGGEVLISANDFVRANAIDTSSFLGSGGDVRLTSNTGDLDVSWIDTQGGIFGGSIELEGNRIQVREGFFDRNGIFASLSTAADQDGGPIAIRYNDGSVAFEVGNAAVNGTTNAITTGEFSIFPFVSFSLDTNAGDIQIIPTNALAPANTNFAPSSNSGRVESGTLAQIGVSLGQIALSARSLRAAVFANRVISSLGEVVETEVAQVDRVFSNSFSRQLGLKDAPAVSLGDAKARLQVVERRTGLRSALIYAFFRSSDSAAEKRASALKSLPNTSAAEGEILWQFGRAGFTNRQEQLLPAQQQAQATDELELVLVTAEGTVIRRRVTGATRRRVHKTARRLLRQMVDPLELKSSRYLTSSRRLYQWLVAPLEKDLQAQGINNLTFLMDAGLRTLPLAALHDGQSFIIERYSLGLMPSLALTDTRYVDLRNTQVLAMGAAEFNNLQSLPAVPVEVDAIAGTLWQGRSFLNEEFTLANLKAARQTTNFGILHLATHADFRPGGTGYIQLWDRERLELEDLKETLSLVPNSPVELLVLSACRTALGDPETELGFAGLAVIAGVKSAIGSLWYVSDEGTLGLMTSFYEQLRQTPVKAEALRQAQLSMLRGEVRLQAGQLVTASDRFPLPLQLTQLDDRDLSHPYYWSAFTMIGNPW